MSIVKQLINFAFLPVLSFAFTLTFLLGILLDFEAEKKTWQIHLLQ